MYKKNQLYVREINPTYTVIEQRERKIYKWKQRVNRKVKRVRICFVLFSFSLANWFAENYQEEQFALQQTDSVIRKSNFSYLWASRETLWIQYCLVYLWAMVLFFLLLASPPYLSQNCTISLFMIPQCIGILIFWTSYEFWKVHKTNIPVINFESCN